MVRRNFPICLLWLHLVATPVRAFTASVPARRVVLLPSYGDSRGKAQGSTPRNRGAVSMGRDGVSDPKKRELLDPTRLAGADH